MRHLKDYNSELNEAEDSTISVEFEEVEFPYRGTDFMVSFEASGNVEYETPQEEEGHGLHKIGGGYVVDDIMISELEISVWVLYKYVSIYPDPEIEGEITDFLLNNKENLQEIENDLIEAYVSRGGSGIQ